MFIGTPPGNPTFEILHSFTAKIGNRVFVEYQLFVEFFGFHGYNPPFLYVIWFLLAVKVKGCLSFLSFGCI
jgi:hypothetical protein